ncbi:class I SAM-dependent methyltransferase [Brevundimonas poindexterae]|uniref:class I SAM-dependent methyltransferase n=1 Tax=Brevundimonas poindexterae TaxID=74325 RepID=UPI001CFED5EA|nr:class I SAM-dependent methyltransferase [Brevundimonas poindexterae]
MTTNGDAQFWDRSSRKYAREPIADMAGYERSMRRTLELLRPSNRVLELGCGTGSSALLLANSVQSYLATDISPGMIEIAREKLATSPVGSLSFRVSSAEDASLDASQYDAVLGFNYLHLVRDLPGTLSRVHHLLKPGGLFMSKTPCLGDVTPLLGKVLLPAMRAIGKAPHVNVLKQVNLVEGLESAMFDVLLVEDHSTRGKMKRPYIVALKPDHTLSRAA